MKEIIKILFADDEKGYSAMIPMYFNSKKINYSFDFTQTAQEAIDNLEDKGFDYDLVIVDLKFQTEDLAGLKILRYLAEKSIEIPSIIITAYANEKNLLECIKERPHKLIEKPFSIPSLSENIKLVLKEAETSKKRTKPHLSTARKALKGLSNENRAKIIVEGLEYLSLDQIDEIAEEIPMIRAAVEEEEDYYDEEEELENKWKEEGGKIPVSILDRANLYLEYKPKKLASGQQVSYGPFLYLRWMTQGKSEQFYAGKLENITDPDLIERLYKRYQEDAYFREDDKLNTIPILRKKYCAKS